MTAPLSDPEAQRTLTAVLDEIVPPREDGLPGAGGLGLATYVAERLGEGAPHVAAGLGELERRAREQGATEYAAAPAEQRVEWLNQVAAARPGFLESLIFHSYGGYYQHPRVVEALGVPPRPPYPEGYPLEAGDLTRLEAVRSGPRRYRQV